MKKLLIVLFVLFALANNANAANMAYFIKDKSYLYVDDTDVADWGTSDYRIEFDIQTSMSFDDDYAEIISGVVHLTKDGYVTVSYGYYTWLTSNTSVVDEKLHHIIIERVSRRLSITIDGTENVHYDNDTYDWEASIRGIFIGHNPGDNHYWFYGYLKNIKCYNGSSLVLNLPLMSDTIDLSDRHTDAVNYNVFFINPDADTLTVIERDNTNQDASYLTLGGITYFLNNTQPIGGDDLNLVGDLSVYTAFNLRTAISLPISISSESTIKSLHIAGKFSANTPTSGVKSRIRLENNLSPDVWTNNDISGYLARRANTVKDDSHNDLYIEWDGASGGYDKEFQTPDLSSLAQQLLKSGGISGLSFFIDDVEGRGSSNNAYLFKVTELYLITSTETKTETENYRVPWRKIN